MKPSQATLPRRFLRLTVWNVLTNLTVPLAGLVDTAMLGHLSEIRFLAGVALASIVFDLLYWSLGFLRMSTTGTTAQAVGRGDVREVHLVLERSLVVAMAAAFAVVALRTPLAELTFTALSGEAAVEAAGREYFDVRILGVPAVLANMVFLGWFLGREESRLALVMTAVANVANIVLNYVFIVRMGLAAEGAGLATMLAQYLSLFVALAFYWRRREGAVWQPRALLDRTELGGLLRLQLDILIRTLCLVTAFALFTNLSALLGTAVLTANTLLLRLLSVAQYMIDGAAYSIESLTGILQGEGDRLRLRRLLRMGIGGSLVFAAVFLAGIVLVPRPALALLTSHGEIVELAASYRGWLVPVLLCGALAYIYDGFFLGLTEGRTLRNSMLVSLLAFFLPLAGLALAARSPGLLWLALSAFMAARAVTLGLASRRWL